MQETSILESVVKRDRAIVIAGLLTVIVLSWIYILTGAGMGMTAFEMSSLSLPWQTSSDMAMPNQMGESQVTHRQAMGSMMEQAHMAMMKPAVWTAGYAFLMFMMWWVMMIAMMLPSASPMILIFARVNRSQKSQGAPFVPTTVFASGYLVAWGAFSLIAVGLQWGLERIGLLSAMLGSTGAIFGGLVLIVTGIYQFTPLKQACLRHCRNPFQFVTHHWRTGKLGAFRMGLDHGGLCVACCWFLMALLFVGSVMNLYWIIGIALFVLLEKTVPAGHWLGYLAGVGLLLWGGWLLAGSMWM
jgi:predicted metal-binding membrane protein